MKNILIILSCVLMVCCQNKSTEMDATMGKYDDVDEVTTYDEEIKPPRTAEPLSPPDASLEKGSKIIRSGAMEIEVNDLEAAKRKVDGVLESCNGYYENEQYRSYGNRISYSLQLRVPNTKFDSLVRAIEGGIGELTSKNIAAKDVTEEYVDLNIRLDNNLAYLEQYKAILKKAKSVQEILEVQDKIRRIEEEIDSKKGRIKYLDDKVRFSTLNIEMTELVTSDISNKPKFSRRLVNAFNNGVQGFLSFIVGLVNLWPFLILLVVLFLGRKTILNRIRRKK